MMNKYADFYLIKAEMGTIERDMHDALRKIAEIYVIFPIWPYPTQVLDMNYWIKVVKK